MTTTQPTPAIDLTSCSCGRACNGPRRVALGLPAFCRIPRSELSGSSSREGVYGTYSAAAAARQDGQRVVSIRTSGGPKRFVLVAA